MGDERSWEEEPVIVVPGVPMCPRAERDAAIARAELAEAQASVHGGEWCAETRAAGRGPCGACAWCCQQMRIGREEDDLAWRKRLEKAEAEVARLTLELAEALSRAELAESSLAAAVEQAGDMQLLANEQEQRAIRAEAELARMRPVLEDNHERFARERGQD